MKIFEIVDNGRTDGRTDGTTDDGRTDAGLIGILYSSSGEDVRVVFIIYGRCGHLSHVTRISRSNFRSPYPWMLHIKCLAVSEKKIFEIVDDGRTDGRTDAGLIGIP